MQGRSRAIGANAGRACGCRNFGIVDDSRFRKTTTASIGCGDTSHQTRFGGAWHRIHRRERRRTRCTPTKAAPEKELGPRGTRTCRATERLASGIVICDCRSTANYKTKPILVGQPTPAPIVWSWIVRSAAIRRHTAAGAAGFTDRHAATTCTLTVSRYKTPTPCVHPTEKFRTAEQSAMA